MKNKLFIFNFFEDILFFSLLMGNKLFFSKKSQPPSPLNIKWSVPYLYAVPAWLGNSSGASTFKETICCQSQGIGCTIFFLVFCQTFILSLVNIYNSFLIFLCCSCFHINHTAMHLSENVYNINQ